MDKKTAKLRIGGHQAKTRRRFALVSSEDVEELRKYKWIFHEGQGYAYRWTIENGQRRMIYLHRHVLGLASGDGKVADHINGNKLDCRKENLRVLTSGQNAQNIRRKNGGTSKFRGVFLSGSKWVATVRSGAKTYYLGRFPNEVAAAIAAQEKRAEVMPFAEPDPELEHVLRQDTQLRLPLVVS